MFFLILYNSLLLTIIFRAAAEQPHPPDDFMNDDMDAYLIAMDTSVAPGPSGAEFPPPSLAAPREPVAPNYRTRTHSEEEEEDGERPPDKKVKIKVKLVFSESQVVPSRVGPFFI